MCGRDGVGHAQLKRVAVGGVPVDLQLLGKAVEEGVLGERLQTDQYLAQFLVGALLFGQGSLQGCLGYEAGFD
jgi:hypothetical protein